MAKKIHLSAKGNPINFDELFLKNQKILAVTGGGTSMNARGDLLGPKGVVVETADERQKQSNPQMVEESTPYSTDNPNAVKMVSIKQNIDDLTKKVVTPKDDVDNSKSPQQVIKELNKRLDSASEKVDVEETPPKPKTKRKIVDSDE